MDLVGFSYNFNLFIKNNTIKADSESIYKLMPFITDGFMPTTGDEITEDGEKYKVLRVQKENEDISTSITFSRKAILIQITRDQEINKDELMKSVDFIFGKLKEVLGDMKGERAACIANVIIENDDTTEIKLYKKFFIDEPEYFEWAVRKAKNFTIDNEKSNSVLSINKGMGTKQSHGTGSISQIEVIIVSCDNNTIIENNTPRFDLGNTSIFNELLTKTKSDLDKVIGG